MQDHAESKIARLTEHARDCYETIRFVYRMEHRLNNPEERKREYQPPKGQEKPQQITLWAQLSVELRPTGAPESGARSR